MIQFIHISWTSKLPFFFQDSAISYAIFRSLNSLSLFNRLLDYNALKVPVNSSYATGLFHSPIKMLFWNPPSRPEKPSATCKTFPQYWLLRKEDTFSTIMSVLISVLCTWISSCLAHSYRAKICFFPHLTFHWRYCHCGRNNNLNLINRF